MTLIERERMWDGLAAADWQIAAAVAVAALVAWYVAGRA
jgi:uncharacterized membrane protein